MTSAGRLLIVDDNESVYKSLLVNFRQENFACRWAADTAQALAAVEEEHFSVVLMDLSLGRENGIDAMREILHVCPGLPVVIITGYGTFETAVKAIKLGAFDFLSKPLEFDKLLTVVNNAIRVSAPGVEPHADADPFLLTQNSGMLTLCKKAARLAATDIPVLITGESGTGKELLAGLIHRHSRRNGKAFVRVNCSAFPDSLVDSELFGHEKGAFTGAAEARAGLFEQADGGTLHLDEIGDMSLAAQAKILRVLENARLRRLGGSRDIPVDVRIVASTNKNLLDLIEQGGFRQDLFYRLNSVLLYIPPLRDRSGDALFLAKRFLAEFTPAGRELRLSPEVEAIVDSHVWPGNVRELRNAIKVAAVICESDALEPGDLPEQYREPYLEGRNRMEASEKDLIRRALIESGGNKKQASARLGISRRTLYNKMDKYGMQ